MAGEILSTDFGMPFLETKKEISFTQIPWVTGVSFGIYSVFDISIRFLNNVGEAVDITGVEIVNHQNLFLLNDEIFSEIQAISGVVQLRTASASQTKFTIKIPGWQFVDFVFVQQLGKENEFIVKLNKAITAVHDSDANVYIPAKSDDPENDIIL